MSSIFINTGQCGNQLGFGLIGSLYDHLKDSSDSDVFFRENGFRDGQVIARAVCLDTEPKVVNECLRSASQHKSWLIDSKSVVYRHGGAGNNWAMGYEMSSGEFLEASVDCIRRELEYCDRPPCIKVIHSVGGGTGSGLGTRITEAISEEFSDVPRMNIGVTPYHFGEVIVQHYNTVLSLSKIANVSHGILLFENEVAHYICTKLQSIAHPTLSDINTAIINSLLPALLPKTNVSTGTSTSMTHDLTHLCSHPGYKFLSVKTVPQTSSESVSFTFDRWESLLSSLYRMQTRGAVSELGDGQLGGHRKHLSRTSKPHVASGGEMFGREADVIPCVASQLILRGHEAKSTSSVLFSTQQRAFVDPPVDGRMATRPPQSTAHSRSFAVDTGVTKYRGGIAIGSTSGRVTDTSGPGGGGSLMPIWSLRHVSWAPSPAYTVNYSEVCCNQYQRSACLVTNCRTGILPLEKAFEKGSIMLTAGAYVHQYQACGLDKNDFIDAFRRTGQIIRNYNDLQ